MKHYYNVAAAHHVEGGYQWVGARVTVESDFVTVQDRRGNVMESFAVDPDVEPISDGLNPLTWTVQLADGNHVQVTNTGGCGGCSKTERLIL